MSRTNNNACIVCAKSFTSSEERDEHEMGQHFCENGVLDLLFSQYDECAEKKSKRRKTEDGNAWAGHNVRMSKLNLFWTQEKQAIRDNRERLLASQSAIEVAIQEHQTKLRDLSSQLDANAESETRLAKQCSIKQNQEAERFKLEKEDRQVQRHQEDFDMHKTFIDGVRRAHVGSKRKVQQAGWGGFPSEKLQPAEYISVAAEALQMMSYSKEMTAAAERAGIEVGGQVATERSGVKGDTQGEAEDVRRLSPHHGTDRIDEEIVVMAD